MRFFTCVLLTTSIINVSAIICSQTEKITANISLFLKVNRDIIDKDASIAGNAMKFAGKRLNGFLDIIYKTMIESYTQTVYFRSFNIFKVPPEIETNACRSNLRKNNLSSRFCEISPECSEELLFKVDSIKACKFSLSIIMDFMTGNHFIINVVQSTWSCSITINIRAKRASPTITTIHRDYRKFSISNGTKPTAYTLLTLNTSYGSFRICYGEVEVYFSTKSRLKYLRQNAFLNYRMENSHTRLKISTEKNVDGSESLQCNNQLNNTEQMLENDSYSRYFRKKFSWLYLHAKDAKSERKLFWRLDSSCKLSAIGTRLFLPDKLLEFSTFSISSLSQSLYVSGAAQLDASSYDFWICIQRIIGFLQSKILLFWMSIFKVEEANANGVISLRSNKSPRVDSACSGPPDKIEPNFPSVSAKKTDLTSVTEPNLFRRIRSLQNVTSDASWLIWSNLFFIPVILLALYRRIWIPFIVYTYLMIFSTIYHICDTDYTIAQRNTITSRCFLPYNVLQQCDFFGGVFSLTVSLLAASALPSELSNVICILATLCLTVTVQVARFNTLFYLIPFLILFVILFTSWTYRTFQLKRLFPPIQWLVLGFIPAILLTISGFIIFQNTNNTSHYAIMHSAWHIIMGLSAALVLPWCEKWRRALAPVVPISAFLSCGGNSSTGCKHPPSCLNCLPSLTYLSIKNRAEIDEYPDGVISPETVNHTASRDLCWTRVSSSSRIRSQLRIFGSIMQSTSSAIDRFTELQFILDPVTRRFSKLEFILPRGYVTKCDQSVPREAGSNP